MKLKKYRAACAALAAAALAAETLGGIGGGESPVGLIETVAPQAGILSAPASATVLPIALDFSGAFDAGSGLQRVELWYRSDTGSWQASGLSQTATSGVFLFTPPANAEGIYHFDLVAVDIFGNTTAAPTGNGGVGQVSVSYQGASGVGNWWAFE